LPHDCVAVLLQYRKLEVLIVDGSADRDAIRLLIDELRTCIVDGSADRDAIRQLVDANKQTAENDTQVRPGGSGPLERTV